MGWRDTQAAVSSGKKNYYKNEDSFGLAFSKGADIIAKSWMQQAADEKEEAKIKAKEERAARRAAAERQRKAEDKAQKNKKNALILSETFSGTNNNPQAVNYFQQQLTLMDGDVGAVMTATQNMVESGRLEFTTETESRELQGPLLRRSDVDTDVADKSTYAAYKNAGAIGDTETKDRIRDTVGDLRDLGGTIKGGMEKQMDAILGPEGENDASLEPVEIEKRGIKITPFGETPAKLDYTRLKTLEDIELYKDELKGDNVTLDADLLKILEDREALLKGRGLKATINSLAGDLEAAKNQLQTAELLKETNTDEYVAIKALVDAEEKNLKPWETILEPDSFVGLDKAALEQKRRVAKSLDAKDDDLKIIDAEIAAQNEIKKPIEWSTITEDNFEGKAKELDDAGDTDGAKRVREYGKVMSADEPLSIVELGKLDSVVLDALSSTVTDADYKSRIDDIRVRKSAQATEETIDSFDIMKYNNADASVLQTAIDAAEPGPIKVQLEALKKHRENNPDNIELDMSAGFLITTYTVGDETFVATAAPTKNGQLYDVDRQKLIPVDANPQSKNVKMIGAQASLLAQMNDKVLVPLTESRREMAYMLESAQRLEKFVDPAQGGKPEILTTVGGDVTRVIKRLENEYDALNTMFLGGSSEAEVFAHIDQSLGNLGETASIASQFQAEVLKFAYLYATVSLEQRGAGLSNTDFANALKIVQAGSDYRTFSGNLRARSKEGIGKVEGRISDITETSAQIKLLDQLDPSGKLSGGYKTSAQDYLTNRGLGNMYTYANSEVTAPIEDPTKTVPKNKPPGQKVSEYKASDTFAADKQKYNEQSPENQRKWAEIMSITHNIPVELIIKAYGGGSN